MNDFRELIVWRRSMNLVMKVYEMVKMLPAEERYALSDQMRRCAVSIPSNIAEGNGRNSSKEYLHFLYIAHGSSTELLTQLLICQHTSLIPTSVVQPIIDETEIVRRMILSLSKKLRDKK